MNQRNGNRGEYVPPTCNDYTFKDGRTRQGCGAEIRLVKTEKGYQACEPFQYPSWDREGNFGYAYVPHWIVCPHAEDQRNDYLDKQEQNRERFRSSRDDSGNQRGSQQSRGDSRNGSRNQGQNQSRSPARGQAQSRPRNQRSNEQDENMDDVPF